MRHHFSDSLDRDSGYWTVVPNRERYAYGIDNVPKGSKDVTIITIGKQDQHWDRAFTLPNLEELTLHEPTKEQLAAAGQFKKIKRLRITHARPKDIEFIRTLTCIEELVLEYVSGFDDLSPLQSLKKLRAVHFENLRRISDFSGLSGIKSLKYLAIHGTLDWFQPIRDFEFLNELPNVEHLGMWQFINRQPFPATLPILSLRKLKKLKMSDSYLSPQECALLEEGFKDRSIDGAKWGPFRTWPARHLKIMPPDIRASLPDSVIRQQYPEVRILHDGTREIEDPDWLYFEFTGKKSGQIKCDSPNAQAKCREFTNKYEAMKQDARTLLDMTKVKPDARDD